MITLVPLATVDGDAVEALLDRAFGIDRHARTAYRLRAGSQPVAELSFAAVENGALLGTIQCWPVALNCDEGGRAPLVMVGPVAVDPDRQQGGIGRRLMAHMLDAVPDCRSEGCGAQMLVGDPEYYGRFFGFTAEFTGGWRLPGPWEPRRLLARGDGVPGGSGMLEPRLHRTG